MSTPNPFLAAGAPELSAMIDAAITFVTNLGPDPTKLALTAGPALQVFLGSVQLQVPVLANAEFGVVQAQAISQLQAAKAKLAAASAPAA